MFQYVTLRHPRVFIVITKRFGLCEFFFMQDDNFNIINTLLNIDNNIILLQKHKMQKNICKDFNI